MDDPTFNGLTWREAARGAKRDAGRLAAALHEAETARDELRAALRSIAAALGMSADALPGAIVERVERIAIEHGDEARAATDCEGKTLAGLRAERDEARAELRYVRGVGTFAEACDLLRAEALDGEGVVDTVRRLIAATREPEIVEQSCTSCDGRGVVADGGCEGCGGSGVEYVEAPTADTIATGDEVRTALGARDGETTLDAARRVASDCATHLVWMRDRERERDEARTAERRLLSQADEVHNDLARFAVDSFGIRTVPASTLALIDAIERAVLLGRDGLGESIEAALGDACTGDLAADVRRVVADLAAVRSALGCGEDDGAAERADWLHERARDAERSLAASRACVESMRRAEDSPFATPIALARIRAAIDAAVPAIRAGLDAAGSHAPGAVAARNAARDALHALAQGRPVGVVLSAEDAAVVRAVLAAAERGHAIAGEGREGDAWDESGLEDAVCDYERAGRPLASKEA